MNFTGLVPDDHLCRFVIPGDLDLAAQDDMEAPQLGAGPVEHIAGFELLLGAELRQLRELVRTEDGKPRVVGSCVEQRCG